LKLFVCETGRGRDVEERCPEMTEVSRSYQLQILL